MQQLARIAVPAEMKPGAVLFPESALPGLWLLLTGELALESSTGEAPAVAREGDIVGSVNTMAGHNLGRSGVVRGNRASGSIAAICSTARDGGLLKAISPGCSGREGAVASSRRRRRRAPAALLACRLRHEPSAARADAAPILSAMLPHSRGRESAGRRLQKAFAGKTSLSPNNKRTGDITNINLIGMRRYGLGFIGGRFGPSRRQTRIREAQSPVPASRRHQPLVLDTARIGTRVTRSHPSLSSISPHQTSVGLAPYGAGGRLEPAPRDARSRQTRSRARSARSGCSIARFRGGRDPPCALIAECRASSSIPDFPPARECARARPASQSCGPVVATRDSRVHERRTVPRLTSR